MTAPVEEPSRTFLKAVKSTTFAYNAPPELSQLLEDFRLMCNDAIRIAFQDNPSNRFGLIRLAYPRLKEYGTHSHYIHSACEVAYSIFKNRGKSKLIPYVTKPFLKLDNQCYTLNHFLLRIPVTPRHFIFIELRGSSYQLDFIENAALKRGSVTISERIISIAFTKRAKQFEPRGNMGLDINERNVTVSATDGFSHKFNELGEVVEIKERYKEIRAKIAKNINNDARLRRELLAKYGNREKSRTESRLHKVTAQIVGYARDHELGIKMERLTWIRNRYKKGNGQGVSFRGRMNSWVFGETQRQIDYKAKWDGVPHWYVNPRGTSSYCLCGSRVAPMVGRKLYCPKCDRTWDRDDLASKNIMACAVPQARPSRGSGEGERGGDGSNPRSGWREESHGGGREPENSQNLRLDWPSFR